MDVRSLFSLLPLWNPASMLTSPAEVGRLPAMGWNSWNEYACDISEDVIITAGQRMVFLGLKDLGYEYVNIDDCWSDKEKRRDNATNEIIPDYVKFPKGINHTADAIHALGLKMGIYSDAGTNTCAGYAGSLGYEEIDAATFSKWGVDYLKYDNCFVPSEYDDKYPFAPEKPDKNPPPPADYDWGTSNTAKRFKAMRNALQKQSRTVQYSLCVWGYAHAERWANSTGHSWRMWGDIEPEWDSHTDWSWGLMPIVNQASFMWNYTNFWGHNDWDMLEVGNGNLTLEENRSHFALWCALKSPLIIGTKLDEIAQPILEILSNRELIAFSQDPVVGESAKPYKWGYNPDGTYDQSHPAEYWVGTSGQGIHIFLINTRDTAFEMSTLVSEIPGLKNCGHSEFVLHDMWTGTDIGSVTDDIKVTLKSHDTAAFRITTKDGKHPNPKWKPSFDDEGN